MHDFDFLANRINNTLDMCKIDLGQLRVEASPSLLRQTLVEVMEIMQSTYRSPEDEKTADILLRLELKESIPSARVLTDVTRIRQVHVGSLATLCLAEMLPPRQDVHLLVDLPL